MPPLPVLLAQVLLDIARAFNVTVEQADEQPSLVLWANLLRVIPDEGIPPRELPAAARISRRAVRAWLGLEKRGWLHFDIAAPFTKTVRLTETGRHARDRWGEILAANERSWSADAREGLALRAALVALVAQLDFELPHYPMIYGPSDVRATGGAAVPARPGPPRIPAHGTDWAPVIRADASSVRDLSLLALLSQTLMAFTIDYEEEARFAMAVAAMLGRTMATGSAPLSALPSVLGVNGSGKTALERHGVVTVSGPADDRVATLTPGGERIRDRHEHIVGVVTETWSDRYGSDVVAALTTSLAHVEKRLGEDVPDQVLVRYAVGRGFVDVSFASAPPCRRGVAVPRT